MDPLERFEKTWELTNNAALTPKDVKEFLTFVLQIIRKSKNEFDTISKENVKELDKAVAFIEKHNKDILSKVEKVRATQTSDFDDRIKELNKMMDEILAIEVKDGDPGADADEEAIFQRIMASLPEQKPQVVDGAEVVSAINALPDSDQYKIDWKMIKNVPDFATRGTKLIGGGGIKEAPKDGKIYGRQNREWVEVVSAGTWGTITGTLSDQTDLQAALDAKVAANGAITGATKTKITYDAKGLVTSGADATTADIADSSNKRYVTDAHLVILGNTSNTNSGDNAVNSLYSGLATSKQDALSGTGFVKISGTTISYDNSTYLTTATAASTYQPLDTQLTDLAGLSYSGNTLKVIRVNAGETGFELATVAAGGGTWGSIGGTLSDQTDLQTALDGKQPIDTDLTTIAGLTATTDNFIVSVASAWASRTPSQVRTTLGLVIGTNVQAWDADLDTWAGLTPSANAQSLVTAANYAAMRALLDLEAGTDFYSISAADAAFQPKDADLTTIAGLTATTDNFIVSVASAWASRTPAQVKTTLALNNVDNTSDAGKPVSTAQQTALDLKANLASPTFSGTVALGTSPTMTTPVITGLPTGTGVASAATASTLVARDANANILAANTILGFRTQATAAGITTLVVGDAYTQVFTGSTTQTVKLPTTSIIAGHQFFIINQSTGLVTVQSSGANTIVILAAGTSVFVTAVVATPTTAANWNFAYAGVNAASGKVGTINNNLTLAGTDGTTMTFPSTSATIARTDAANTFTGNQTFSGTVILGTQSITMTGSIGATAARVTKGWFTDLEVTNDITVNGAALASLYQPKDADLTTIAGLTATTDNFIVSVASAWASRTPAQVKTTLALNSVENTALSTWAGTANIVTHGTITSGGLGAGAVIGGVTMTLGSDSDGDIYYRSSNVLTRLAKGTAGQVLTMNAGATAPSWATPSGLSFAPQIVPLLAGSGTASTYAMTSSTDGTVLFIGFEQSTTISLYRLLKDKGSYYITHTTTITTSGGGHGIKGMAIVGSNLYVSFLDFALNKCNRYTAADLTSVQAMTISGTNDFGQGTMFTDGTSLYVYSSSGTFRTYSISGTTVTSVTTVSFTSAGVAVASISDGTNVWISDSDGSGTFNIRKYAIAGGAVVSTTSPILRNTAEPNGLGMGLFIGSASVLGIGYSLTLESNSAVKGTAARLIGITLP